MIDIFKNSVDHSIKLESYTNGKNVSEDFLTSEFIEVGYFKPINSLFIDVTTQALVNNLIVEYWNGSSWENANANDRTFGLSKSGFISWGNKEDQSKNTLNSKEQYWYRLSIDQNDIEPLTINGINLVFSDDSDLIESYPDIMEYLADGAVSFISYHQSARNFILTYLRNKGKQVASYGAYKMLDQFDLHNYEEVKQASKYKALAMIFYNQSDRSDDKWYQKAKDFDAIYGESINMNFLSLDLNNDGKIDASETQAVQFIKVQRL